MLFQLSISSLDFIMLKIIFILDECSFIKLNKLSQYQVGFPEASQEVHVFMIRTLAVQ